MGWAAVFAMDITQATQWPDITQSLASGKTVVLVQDLAHAWVIDTAKFPQRSVERPQTELAVRGPEEAFNEVLGTQKAHIRHRLPSPDLVSKTSKSA
jgi:spore germination protein KA